MKNFIMFTDLPVGYEEISNSLLKDELGIELYPIDYEYYKIPSILSLDRKSFREEMINSIENNIELKGAENIIFIHYSNCLSIANHITEKNQLNISIEKSKIIEKIKKIMKFFKNKNSVALFLEQNTMIKETEEEGIYEMPMQFQIIS